MTAPARRFALMVHVACSVGWIGAVVAYIGLGVAATRSDGPDTVRAAWVAMEIVGWWALVPLSLGACATGVVMSLGTQWGLFRHYWVLATFVLTTLATLALILHMRAVSTLADEARTAAPSRLDGYGGDLFHGVLALVFLLAVLVLNVYKPQGLTRFGWHKGNLERKARRTRRRKASAPPRPDSVTPGAATDSPAVP